MTNKLNDKFAHFTRNGERAVEEGRISSQDRDRWYADMIVNPLIKQTLTSNYLNLKDEKNLPIISYIGTLGNKCYIITPVKGDSTNELAYELGCHLMGAINSGMQIGKAGCMKLSGALKKTGTTIDVDNDAQVNECQSKPKAHMKEQAGYMVLEVESNQNPQDVKDYFFKKFNQNECQPKALKEKGMRHEVERIDGKELGIFLAK